MFLPSISPVNGRLGRGITAIPMGRATATARFLHLPRWQNYLREAGGPIVPDPASEAFLTDFAGRPGERMISGGGGAGSGLKSKRRS